MDNDLNRFFLVYAIDIFLKHKVIMKILQNVRWF